MARPPAPHGGPFVRIVEQPAGKAMRFRYECEGRSAGSIPGVNSAADRKTYPTIEVCGHTGKAIIVVSCVTREEPYKPHPHNLVGRERCKSGVCTVKQDLRDSSLVSFSNLGIQCVKRRDIVEALRVREGLRVDPFRTGFAHMHQPQSIDLNAVRLCFQVFLQDEAGAMRHSLQPVVSDVIYDRKAVSELQILRISRPSGSAKGGTEVILLCEKVTREDISVVVYEKGAGGGAAGGVAWEESGNIIIVHKQVAIAFTTPPYRNPHTGEHREVFIQLKRVSDNGRSNSVPFTYIPEYQGTTARKPLPDLSLLTLLLTEKRDDNNNDKDKTDALVSSTSDSVGNGSDESGSATLADINGNMEVMDEATQSSLVVASNEKSLNDLLDQVAELDEIYSENRTRLQNVTLNHGHDDSEDFNDAGTYTSLQLAFKNPVDITEPEPYEDVQVQTFRGPIIEFSPLKRDTDDERAPPLPPKRVRKTPTEPFKTSQTSVDSILKPGRQIPVTRNQVVNRDRTELSVARSEPALPPVKRRSFFSRIFRRKEKSPAPSVKSEGKKDSKPIGRSVSSVSGLRPSKFKSSVSHTSLKDNASTTGLTYADSITHISLHGDENEKSTSQSSLRRPASLAPLPPTDGDTILVAESVLALDASAFKKLQDDLDLTEAEHYALYMAVAPHATVSEFDETSCYYSPIDGNTEYLKRKRQKTLTILQQLEQEKPWGQEQKPIKAEPSDKGSPRHMGGSPLLYTPLEQVQDIPYQQWMQDPLQGASMAGSSMTSPPYYTPQNAAWPGPGYAQPMQARSPNMLANMPATSPNMLANMPATSPNMLANMPATSPNMQMSQNVQVLHNMQVVSPGQAMSPQGQGQVMSPQGQVMSPQGQVMAPGPMMSPHMMDMDRQCGVSPGMAASPHSMGHVSPNVVQQAMDQQQQMEVPSLSGLLTQDSAAGLQFNSGDLSNLSALLGQGYRSNDLSDSLNRLSTGDLYPTVDM